MGSATRDEREEEYYVRISDDEKIEDNSRITYSETLTERPEERRSRLMRQSLKIFLLSFGLWCEGSMIAFPSVFASDLSEHNTTIFGSHITFNDSQMDMMGSLMTLSSLLGVWIIAPIMVLWGRRPSMLISGTMLVLGWLGVILSPSSTGMLVSRCISGFAAGCTIASLNTYVIEMADSDVRGVMFIFINNGILAGQVMTMVLGTLVRYFVLALIDILLPIIFLIAVIWLPESPSFLVIKGYKNEARKVLFGLRGPAADVDAEIQTYEEMNQLKRCMDGSKWWKELFKPHFLRPIFCVCSLFMIIHFTGYTVVAVNTYRIFKAAGSTVDKNVAAVIITVVQLSAGIAASFLIDRIGRRKCLLLSCTLMGIPLAILAVYVGVVDNTENGGQETYGWVPLVCLIVSQAAAVTGVIPVPYILCNEYFPTTLRSQACTICYMIGMLSNFTVLQLYTPMMNGLTQTGLYAFYASFCAIGVPFSYFFVRETMGELIG